MRHLRRSLPILVVFLAVSGLAAGTAMAQAPHGKPGHGAASQPAAATVTITDQLRFVPDKVTIHAGQTVVWKNTASSAHTVVDDPAKAKNKADVSLPAGATPIDVKVAPGKTYSHTFTVPGTYKYVCVPHESKGMKGTVEVLPATGASPAHST